jgi:hypothetical protein
MKNLNLIKKALIASYVIHSNEFAREKTIESRNLLAELINNLKARYSTNEMEKIGRLITYSNMLAFYRDYAAYIDYARKFRAIASELKLPELVAGYIYTKNGDL